MSEFVISEVMPGKLNALVKNLMRQMEVTDPNEAVRRVNSGEYVVVEAEKPKKLSLLDNVTLPPRADTFDPHEFFKTRPGLYVWEDFAKNILAVAKPVNAASDLVVGKFRLENVANDAEIQAELPEDHVFEDASTFCVYLAGMIERQWGGTAGDLLNNGYANLFYVYGVDGGVFRVHVGLDSDDREWGVSANSLSGRQWDAGRQTFSATAGAVEAQAV